tara:strand:+ start:7494 stop:9152 length:1659 start_codon:yes stop_codon:yes gene_type:complete
MGMVFKRIFGEGVVTRPFKAHKRYEVTNVNYSSSFELSILRGISDNGILLEMSTSVAGQIGSQSFLTGSGAATTELNNIPQKVVWGSLNSTFFKKDGRLLHPTASIFSIPQNKFGEGIKPKSVFIQDYSYDVTATSLTESKIDNMHGVLYDNDIQTSHFPSVDSNVLYLGFQDGTLSKNWKSNSDKSNRDNTIITSNLNVVSGINVTGTHTDASGYAVSTNIDSSLIIKHKSHFRHLNNVEGWAVSAWIKLPSSQSYTDSNENVLISKRYQHTNDEARDGVTYSTKGTPIYPFELSVYNQSTSNNGKVKLSVSDGLTSDNEIITTPTYNDGAWHHYLIHHSGSGYVLEVDGNTIDTLPHFARNTQNNYDISVGCLNSNTISGTSASFDEVRIYKTELTTDNRSSLRNNHWYSGSAYQTNKVGYVFYQHGMIVVSDPRPKYQNIFLGNGNWDYTSKPFQLDYRATKTVEEVSILCEINKNEYNVSSNPSVRINNDLSEYQLKDAVTTTDFRPYITQVGLYNDNGELLALAKLGSPLKKREDVDVTINIKFDID